MKKTAMLWLSLLCVCLSCRKEPDLSRLSSNFVVQTDVDPDASFSNYKTFYISDTMAYITGDPKDSVLTDSVAKALTGKIRSNLVARGFVSVSLDQHPDLGVNTVAVKSTSVGVVVSPGWWDGYPGYWDPWYWGWYYPYYYPWTTAYAITTGTVIGTLVDLKNADKNQKLEVVWTMSLNSALGSNPPSNLQRALDGIDQAFTQSPYLKAQ